MKEVRFKVVGMLLLLCLLLSGCRRSLKDYLYTESGLKQEAEKDLEEKYDEEFVIHNAWWSSPGMYTATCSPKSDMEVVFETRGFMDERGVYKDEYLQGVVTKHLSEKILVKLKPVFGEECYVKAHFYGKVPTLDELKETYKGEMPFFDYFKNLTVEEYYELDKDPYLSIWIFVNIEKLNNSEEQVKKEFECLSGLFNNEPMKEAGGSCYFVDGNTLNECKEYLKKDSTTRGDFDDIVNDIPEFGFGFDVGSIKQSFEEYNKARKEVENNG